MGIKENIQMKARTIVILLLSVALLSACAARPNPTVFVDLFFASYTPGFDTVAYQDFRGKTVIFDSIRNEARNTTMLGYYSADGNIRYSTNYMPGKMSPPLESFLWYTLQKSFAGAGITATSDNVSETDLNLHLTILSMNDQEAKFRMQLLRGGKVLSQNDITATNPPSPTADTAELEKRSYAYFDAITVAILNHPDFKKEILTPQEKPAQKDEAKR
jgi:hypothetical protein